MNNLVTLTLTDSDCLSLRLALNAHAMHWGEVASAHRAKGEDVDAATCERIRSDYHRLWDTVNAAQEANGRAQAAPEDAFDRPADDVARRQRNTADAYAHKPVAQPIAAPDSRKAWRVLNAADRARERRINLLQQIADTAF
jgi:hypothetical protein